MKSFFFSHVKECVTEAEQQDYMKIHQSYKKWTQESPANDSRMSSEHEVSHEPLRLTRVVTSTLPTSLIAEHIFVDDPYPEPPEQISLQSGLRNSQRRAAKKPSRTLHETTDKTDTYTGPTDRKRCNKRNRLKITTAVPERRHWLRERSGHTVSKRWDSAY